MIGYFVQISIAIAVMLGTMFWINQTANRG
jgi:hypothetical protein